MNKRYSKLTSGILATSLLWTGVSWTTSTASAAATPFSDISAGHWAEKHIAKLALQGILKGGTNGKFNPNNAVSRQEAIIIALRFMGVEDEVQSSDVLVFPSSLEIKEDYKPYIKLALQRKILFIDEEVALAEKEKGKAWGSSPATREWMTRLLVRAIGKDAEAKLAETKTTTFTDDSKIDAKLRGYVNVAVTTGVVTGVTATTFDPSAPVTRATASTLFSRAESQISVAYDGQVSGVLMAIDPQKLTLLHSDGVMKDYTLTPSSAIFRADSDKASSVTGLKLYGEVNLINSSNGSIAFVEQTNDAPKVKTVEGTLRLVVKSKNRLTISVGNSEEDYYYDANQLPKITDANGQALTLDTLPVNLPVKLLIDAVRAEGKVLSVSVNQSVTNKSGTGTVVAWDAVSRTLQVKDPVSSNTESLSVSANATIKSNGVNLSLNQLKVGDEISYEVKTGTVTDIVITKTEQPDVTGVLLTVDKTNKTISYTLNNKPEADYLADKAVVKIDGFSDATLDDLFKGDAVTLTFDDSGKVSEIKVTNRSVKSLTAATVSSFDANANTLIVFDAANKKYNLDISETTTFDLNGTALSLKDAIPYLTTKGKKVSVNYSETSAISVSIIAQYTGTVLENNTSAKTLKLALDSVNTVTVKYANPTVEIYGTNGETYANIRIGDQVTVTLNNTQDQAASILVQKNAQFEFSSADLIANKLLAKRSDGYVEQWTLSPAFPLQDENGALIGLNALGSGSLLNVTFQGNTPIKIKTVSVAFGRVVSINTAGSTIDIATANGPTATKSVGTSPLILKNGVAQGSLAAVLPEDRVEIRKDENDRVVIQIVPALRKQFRFADNTAHTLNVLKESLSDNKDVFSVHPQAYIHQGASVLNLTDLRNGDPITLYVLRDKVVEIVK